MTAPYVLGPPDLPPPPAIDLLRPDISKPVRNPVSIDVRFTASPGHAIDMRTFKVTYGWLRIDITTRLPTNAVKTPCGLSAENVNLPPGDHRVTLSLADTFGQGGIADVPALGCPITAATIFL